MAQNGPNMGPKWVQNGSNMGPKWVPGSSSLLTSIFENEFPPFWAQLGPNLGPKWVQNWSKFGQKSMPKMNLKLYRFFDQNLIKIWSKNRWKMDDFWACNWMWPTCENRQKPLKKQMVFDDFSGLGHAENDEKTVKKRAWKQTPEWPPFWTHVGPQNGPKIVQKWIKNRPKTGSKKEVEKTPQKC